MLSLACLRKGVKTVSVLSDTSLRKLYESGIQFITPYRPDSLEPASYDMHLHWRLLVSPTRREQGRAIDLRTQPKSRFSIDTGRLVGVLTEEEFDMPLYLSARFGLRSEFTRQGLVAFGGIQIDPGFRGRLAMSLFHTGPEPVELENGQKMFTVEFHRLEESASRGYSGIYQGHADFHPAQEKFILEANTASLSEIGGLPVQLENLSLRLAQHEATHRTMAPLSVVELAEIQGVAPVADLGVFAGFWPDDDSLEDFRAFVKRNRNR